MNIHTLDSRDAAALARWDTFVQAHPQATFFHLSGWLKVIEQQFKHRCHFLYACDPPEQGGAVRGVLPLAHMSSLLFGTALTSLPFAVYGGVVAQDEATEQALLRAADELGRELGVQHLELRHQRRTNQAWPEQDLYVTFRKAIDPDEEANMLAIPRKQRAMVRKGIKNGLTGCIDTAEGGPGVARFFQLYADNVHRHGTPALPRRYFQALCDTFGPQVEVLTVQDAAGTPVSSVLSFYFRDEVLPYYAGDAVAARELAANDFKYWDLMRRACARGLKTFDYGRSKRGTGSFDFKKNWGFEPAPLHYEYRLYKRDAVPQNNPNNPKYRLLIQAWRRLPLTMANWLGPHLVRSLG